MKIKHLGRYTLLGKLGQGGMATVYRAAMPITNRVVALKHLDPFEALIDISGMEKLKAAFTAEAVTMARFRHPAIADVWDFDHDEEGKPFFIMEYYCNNLGLMIGEHYRLERATRIIPAEKTIRYGQQILEGLACLHEGGIIHRDIKPYNIMITDQDTLKICDFGMSKQRGETFSGPENLRIGSPHYAAPEQQRDPQGVDERADLYSVGVLLYRMLTGELPSMKSFSLSLINPLYDEKWDGFFHKALDWQKEKRFGNAVEMLGALNDLIVHWDKATRSACELSGPVNDSDSSTRRVIRGEAIRVSGEHAKNSFELDELFQPLHLQTGQLIDLDKQSVRDETTGLTWQKSGSLFLMDRLAAARYIHDLNTRRHEGCNTWRLPTVNELLTLVRRDSEQKVICGDSPLQISHDWLWSCDRRSPQTSWFVNINLPYVGWQDDRCRHYVIGVHG